MRFSLYSIILFLFLFSCTNDLSNDIKEFQKHPVDLSILSQQGDTSFINEEYKYIIFFDSTECSSCAVKNIWQWDDIINECRGHKIGFYAIMEPSSNTNLSTLTYEIKASRAKIKIKIDTLNIFSNKNPQLAANKLFHCFLLNNRDSVLLVGNPTQNKKIEELMYKIIGNRVKILKDYSN